ncbi:MAG: hypothetical protein AAF235_02355, partial [Planctomycetota bacterium]
MPNAQRSKRRDPSLPELGSLWSALLGRWVELARASAGLPETPEAEAWRRCVPGLIALQAVTHALDEIDDFDDDERSVAIDKASLLVGEHAGTI